MPCSKKRTLVDTSGGNVLSAGSLLLKHKVLIFTYSFNVNFINLRI